EKLKGELERTPDERSTTSLPSELKQHRSLSQLEGPTHVRIATDGSGPLRHSVRASLTALDVLSSLRLKVCRQLRDALLLTLDPFTIGGDKVVQPGGKRGGRGVCEPF